MNANEIEPGRLYSYRQVAEVFAVTVRTIESWVSKGILPSVRVAHTRRILGAEVLRLMGPVNDGLRETTRDRARRVASAAEQMAAL